MVLVLGLRGGGLGSSPVRRCCLGEQVFVAGWRRGRGKAGLPSLLPQHHKERGRKRLCPVALPLGPMVSSVLGEDPFLEQRNHRDGDTGSIGRY